MAETKFTNGPWTADGEICTVSEAFLLWCGAVNPPEVDGFRGSICRIQSAAHLDGDPISNAEAEANAYLIAAAPALYEALSECLQLHYPFTGKYDEKQSLDHWLSEDKEGNGEAKFWIAAHAALALAEGKQ